MAALIFIRHLWRQGGDVLCYCWMHGVWWPIPVIAALVVAGGVAASAPIVAPYIYTLF